MCDIDPNRKYFNYILDILTGKEYKLRHYSLLKELFNYPFTTTIDVDDSRLIVDCIAFRCEVFDTFDYSQNVKNYYCGNECSLLEVFLCLAAKIPYLNKNKNLKLDKCFWTLVNNVFPLDEYDDINWSRKLSIKAKKKMFYLVSRDYKKLKNNKIFDIDGVNLEKTDLYSQVFLYATGQKL